MRRLYVWIMTKIVRRRLGKGSPFRKPPRRSHVSFRPRVMMLEERNAPGSLFSGLGTAALGDGFSPPIMEMVAIVGESALAAPPIAPTPGISPETTPTPNSPQTEADTSTVDSNSFVNYSTAPDASTNNNPLIPSFAAPLTPSADAPALPAPTNSAPPATGELTQPRSPGGSGGGGDSGGGGAAPAAAPLSSSGPAAFSGESRANSSGSSASPTPSKPTSASASSRFSSRPMGGSSAPSSSKPPLVDVPNPQSTPAGTPLVFSTTNQNAVSVFTAEYSLEALTVHLSAASGTLTLAQTTGLSFSSGTGTKDTAATFTGTFIDINNALDGLIYKGNAGQSGSDTLNVSATDSGGTTSASVAIAPTLPAFPRITVPDAQTASANAALAFSSATTNLISVADPSGGGPITVGLAVSFGTLSLAQTTGLTFARGTGKNDVAVTFTGAAADVNAALDGWNYTPLANYVGADTLSITSSDSNGRNSASVGLTVAPTAPTITSPAAQTAVAGVSQIFSSASSNAVSIAIVGGTSTPVTINLAVSYGTLTLAQTTGLTFTNGTGSNDTIETFSGTAANINAALDGLSYKAQSSYSGADSLAISADDQGHSSSATVDLTVVPAGATVSGPGDQATTAPNPIVFSNANGNAIAVADNGPGTGRPTIALSVASGTLTLAQTTGLTFTFGTGTNDRSATFSGTLSAVNAALDGLSYTPNASFSGSDTINVSATDMGNNFPSQFRANLNVAPATGPVWIVADSASITAGDSVNFTVLNSASPPPTYASVQWDFNYNGTTFNPNSTASGLSVTNTLATAGSPTVAARLTDSGGQVSIVTLKVTVSPPPPTLTVPGNMTVTTGVAATLQATASSASGIAKVEWLFAYNGGAFQADPNLTTLTATKVFQNFGEYDVIVRVTDGNGETTVDGFHVRANEQVPTDSISVAGPIDEGSAATFTVTFAEPDAADTASIFVDWTGSGTFEEIDPANVTVNFDGTVSFTHVYDDTNGSLPSFNAQFRIENDGGQPASQLSVPVVVNAVPLSFTLTAGVQLTTAAQTGLNLWRIVDDQEHSRTDFSQTVDFSNLIDPAAGDTDASPTQPGLLYHWRVTDAARKIIDIPNQPARDVNGYFATAEGSLELPDFALRKIYWVQAYATDNEDQTAIQTITVVMGTNDGAVATFDAQTPDPHNYLTVVNYGDARLGLTGNGSNVFFASSTPALGQGFGQVVAPNELHTGIIGENDPFHVTFWLDSHSEAVARKLGYTIVYTYSVVVKDVAHTSIGPDHNYVIATGIGSNSSGVVTIGYGGGTTVLFAEGDQPMAGFGKDREIDVATSVAFYDQSGQLVTSFAGQLAVAKTPLTSTTYQDIKELINTASTLTQSFGTYAGELLKAILENPKTFLTTLSTALGGAFKQIADEIVTDPLKALQDAFVGWLQGSGLRLPGPPSSSPPIVIDQANPVVSFLLQYSGVNWDSIQQQVLQQVGAGNIAAFEQVTGWFGNTDANDSSSLLNFVSKLPNFDWTTIQNQLTGKFGTIVQDGLKGAAVQLAAKFVPGIGLFKTIIEGVQWLMSNQSQLQDIFDAFVKAIDPLVKGDDKTAQKIFVDGIKKLGAALLSAFAAQVGLSKLPQELQKAVSFVPDLVNKAIAKTVGSLAATLRGTAVGGKFDGLISTPAPFTYTGIDYQLWVADKGGRPQVFVSKVGDLQPIGALTEKSFSTTASAKDIKALIAAAVQYAKDVKAGGKKTAKAGDTALSTLRTDLKALKAAQNQIVKTDIPAGTCTVLNGCFRADAKLRTRDGLKRVEEIQAGELLQTRDEFDADGELVWKAVEEKFERTGRILEIDVDGREIGTTPEHPFFVRNPSPTREQGSWTAAGALQVGDEVRTDTGWATVEAIRDTGIYETVYNLRVADHHTYFVSDDDWGFAVWAHNACVQPMATAGTGTFLGDKKRNIKVYGTAQNTGVNQHATKINAIVKELAAQGAAPAGTYFVLNRQWNTALNNNGQNIDITNPKYRTRPDILIVEPLGGATFKIFGIEVASPRQDLVDLRQKLNAGWSSVITHNGEIQGGGPSFNFAIEPNDPTPAIQW